VVATSFVSAMATTVYAAHSIAITAEELFYIPGYGMQAATSTLIGNAIGENNQKKERSVIRWSLTVIFLLMCVTGVLLFVGARFMMSLFTTDTEVIDIGTRLLRIVAFTEPVFGSAAVLEGIFDGMAHTRYPFVVTLISRWGVRILGSWICVRVFQAGIDAIWYCMIGDNILKAVLLGIGLFRILKASEDKRRES
jgi:Na+-driven multidrug efflux pump